MPSSSGGPHHRGADRFYCRPKRYYIDVLLPNSYFTSNSRDRETVQNMSPDDSSLRTGSIWLAFVTGENVLDSLQLFYACLWRTARCTIARDRMPRAIVHGYRGQYF